MNCQPFTTDGPDKDKGNTCLHPFRDASASMSELRQIFMWVWKKSASMSTMQKILLSVPMSVQKQDTELQKALTTENAGPTIREICHDKVIVLATASTPQLR